MPDDDIEVLQEAVNQVKLKVVEYTVLYRHA